MITEQLFAVLYVLCTAKANVTAAHSVQTTASNLLNKWNTSWRWHASDIAGLLSVVWNADCRQCQDHWDERCRPQCTSRWHDTPWDSVHSGTYDLRKPTASPFTSLRHWLRRQTCRLNGHYTMSSFLYKIACHHAGPSGQTLTQQTSSPSDEMNGSQLRWSIPPQWMIPLSSKEDSTYLDNTGYSWTASGPTKITAHLLKEVWPCSNRHVSLWQTSNDVTYSQQLPTVQAGGDCSDCTQLMTLLPNGWRLQLVNALENNNSWSTSVEQPCRLVQSVLMNEGRMRLLRPVDDFPWL